MVPECHHTKTSGGKCGSPALRGQLYCYFHSPLKQRAKQPHTYSVVPLFKDLANLEDREGIQRALTNVAKALAENRIEPRRAGLILYALQIAAGNAKKAEQMVSSEAIAKPAT